MKKSFLRQPVFLSLFFVLFVAYNSYSQGDDAGIRIVSGNKMIYEDLTILKDLFDEVYAQKKSEILTEIKEYVRKNLYSVGSLSAILQEKPVLHIVEENNKVIIRYTLQQNRINFDVARMDVPLSVYNSRTNDSEIRIEYDITIDFELKQDLLVDDLRFRKGIWTCDVTRLAITKRDSDPGDVENNRNRIKNELPIEILGVFGPLMAIQSSLNESIVSKIQKNEKLIEEMAIDEDRKIQLKADLVNNVLVINHPHSSIGMAKRAAKQNPAEANDPSKAATSIQPKTTTSAAEINKPAAVNQAGTIKKTLKGIH